MLIVQYKWPCGSLQRSPLLHRWLSFTPEAVSVLTSPSFIAQTWKQANGARYKSFVVLWMRQFCSTNSALLEAVILLFTAESFLLFVIFVSPTPILVSSLLQRWSPWLTLNTSYCLCTLRSILAKTGSGEKMTMITPDWPSKTFL